MEMSSLKIVPVQCVRYLNHQVTSLQPSDGGEVNGKNKKFSKESIQDDNHLKLTAFLYLHLVFLSDIPSDMLDGLLFRCKASFHSCSTHTHFIVDHK